MSAKRTSEISDWLEKLGMSEYAQRFAENDIDLAVLPHLTDQDLKDIGVLARASAKNAGGDRGACWRTHQQRRSLSLQPSRKPKTPPSAAKSR